MTLSNEQWGLLQSAFATKPPVVVLGPGCHRIAYDDGRDCSPWSRVASRIGLVSARMLLEDDFATPEQATPEQAQLFLEDLWLSKFSDEALADPERVDEERAAFRKGTSGDGKRSAPSLERARTALATAVFGVLFESTRCLGNVIATGASPVLDWQSVSHRRIAEPVHARDEAAASDALEANQARVRAGQHLKASVEVAGLLAKWSTSAGEFMGAKDQAISEQRGLAKVELDDKTQAGLSRLKVGAIATALRQLQTLAFEGNQVAITGALVEWLADLFWHLMVTDSGVPPSQSEIAFYVNLTDREIRSNRDFGRLRFGETRGGIEQSLTGDVQRLLGSYDSGAKGWKEIAPPRREFLRTLAATVLESYEQWAETKRIVVLIPDFDVCFERALLELMEPQQALHVVVPVWRHPDRARPQWVVGTTERREGTVSEKHVTSISDWSWYSEQPGHGAEEDTIRGPILVKLNGSPLHTLDSQWLSERLGLRDAERVGPATIYTEFDSLRVILSFAELQDVSGLAADVGTALNWSSNSWVLLGDSFPDWLPRVRLLFNAGAGERGQGADVEHLAVDRQFEFPEVALLEALQVGTLREELSRLARYPYVSTAVRDSNQKPKVKAFLANVRSRLEGA